MVRRNALVLWRRTLDGAVLLPPDGGPIRLNGTAAVVWQLLDEDRSVDDLVVTLVEGTQGSPDVIERDVRPLLQRFVADRLAIEAS